MDRLEEEPGAEGGLLSAYLEARATAVVDDDGRMDDEHDDYMNPSLVSDIRDKFTKRPQHLHHTPVQHAPVPHNAALNYIEEARGQPKPHPDPLVARDKSIAWADTLTPKSEVSSKAPAKGFSQTVPLNIFSKSPHQSTFFSSTDRSGLTVSLEIDLALKKDALENITERESIIQRLHQLKFGDPMTTKTHVKRLVQELRNSSLFVVESIVAWRRSMQAKDQNPALPPIDELILKDSPPKKRVQHVFFRWRDENYLLKMLTDMNFVAQIPQILEILPSKTKVLRNPFLLPYTVDDLNLMAKDSKTISSSVDLLRARQASRILLMEEKDELQRRFEEEEEKKESASPPAYSEAVQGHGHHHHGRQSRLGREEDVNIDTSLPRPPHLNTRELKVFSKLSNPPLAIAMVFACVKILVRPEKEQNNEIPTLNRKVLRNMMRKPMQVVEKLNKFDPNAPVHPHILEALYPIVTNPKFSPENICKISESIGGLTAWVKDVIVEKCISLGWQNGKPSRSNPVTPFAAPESLAVAITKSGKASAKDDNQWGDSSSEDSDDDSKSRGRKKKRGEDEPSNNEYVELLKQLQQEIASLKQNLNNQGLFPQAGDAPASSTASYSSSVVPPPPDGPTSNNQQSTVHLTQESIRLSSRQIIVKVSYTDHGKTLNFTAWDPMISRVIKPTSCPALYCDQVCNYSPVELEAMPETFRRQKLRALVDMLKMKEDATNSNVNRLSIDIDRIICSGKRSIDDSLHEFKILRTEDNDGLVVSLQKIVDDPSDYVARHEPIPPPLTLQISDAELELLLAHQPGLFLRSQRKWSSQRAICDWLVTRILIVKGDDGHYLTVDRSVPVPRNVEKGQTKEGTKYRLQARQFNNEIILEAVPPAPLGSDDFSENPDDFWANMDKVTTNLSSPTNARPMSRVKIGLAEFQSLGAPENIPELEEFPSKPTTGHRPLPGTADSTSDLDLGRPARTPLDSLLSRLSWSIKNGKPVLGINRVVFQETKSVSGVPTIVRASVMNKDIIFQATRLKLKTTDYIEHSQMLPNEQYEKVGEELVKLVTEVEARKLLSDEQDSRKSFLLHPANRQEMCRVLSDKLKLIKSGISNYRLETLLHREKSLLAIAVDSNHRDDVIGAVDIDDQTTLASLRKLINREMDEEDVPYSFRFNFQGAPCSKSQEAVRLASQLLPVAVILSKGKKRRPMSAPHTARGDEDADSEFGNPKSYHDWDSDSAESGATHRTSRSRKQRRKNRAKTKKKQAKKKKEGGLHLSLDDQFEVDSELSNDSDFDLDGSETENSMSLSKSSKASTKSKKRRKTVAKQVVTKRKGSIVEKKILNSPTATGGKDGKDGKKKAGTAAKKDEKEKDKEKEKEKKKKVIPKVALPLPSLVTATQDSVTLKTQVDMTNMLFRGDVVRIYRCTAGFADWSISSDPQAPFNETTLTLSKPYVHKLKNEEEADGNKAEKASDPNSSLPSFLRPKAKPPGSPTHAGPAPTLAAGAAAGHQFEDDEEANRVYEAGEVIPDMQIWVMANPNQDKRPTWRKMFDDGLVKWEEDFADSERFEEHFGVKMPWSFLEKSIADVHGSHEGLLHEQRINYFDKVTPSKIVAESYGVLCRWHPVASSVDNVKWAKFAREMKLFPAKNSSQVDLAFAKTVAGKKERKLDLKGFIQCCTDIALLRFPHMKDTPVQACTHLLMENVVLLPQVNKLAWKEAKRLAIIGEARRICAEVRIASFHRRNVCRVTFLRKKFACIRTQVQLRRMVCRKNLKQVMDLHESNRRFRIRHASAVKCQKMARGYQRRKAFLKHLQDLVDEERQKIANYRKRLNDKRKKKKAATVYKVIKVIQGLYVLIELIRKDNRRQSNDYGLHARVYLPSTQEIFHFTIEEDMLREYLEQAMETEGLSVQEMMEPSSLVHLSDRFMIRVTNERPIVLFSRRNTTERGLLVNKGTERVSGELFVMFVYRSPDDVVFRAYDPKTCGQLRCLLTLKQLRQWLLEENHRRIRKEEKEYKLKLAEAQKIKQAASWGEEVDQLALQQAKEFLASHKLREEEKEKKRKAEQAQEDDEPLAMVPVKQDEEEDEEEELTKDMVEEEKKKEEEELALILAAEKTQNEQLSVIEADEPFLMKPENQEACVEWLLQKLRLSRNKRTKRTRLVLQYEEDVDAKDEAACKLQGIWRQKKARQKMRHKARQQYEKMWDKDNYCYYYMNLRTGVADYKKPLILGSEDLDDPVDEWRMITNETDGSVYYQNPATGQTAYISEDEAARKIQRLIRDYQASDIPTPTITEVVKALRFQRVAEENYAKDPNKLANIVNMALLSHCLLDDFAKARECYNLAMKKSSTNPVLIRAYAIFTLAACDNPKAKVFKKANEYFKAASLSDPELEKWEVAQNSFFHWAVVSNPKDPRALLNYALLHQCVLKDYDLAEKFYMRALAVAPTDTRIIENFEQLEKQRLPGGAYVGRGPSNVVLKRSEVVEEKAEWGEWQRMFDRKSSEKSFKHFWYNRLGRFTQFVEPKWNEVWQQREERSEITYENEADGWVTFWDGQLGVEFYYNRLSREYQAAEEAYEGGEVAGALEYEYYGEEEGGGEEYPAIEN
ncbi:hypothetical protein TrVE_jg7560 [Triparma verrucosa]|uniref:Dynein heavy chain coiled coil stalk domain-containing protein n=1 Tax=Triparma verrucosa TaxID=1606542 RepID=A0A9W7BTQ5_9STRA|nr:hypothetical protein TrVE_jg7560 [Triparma verrucosa]